jgi:hypothetical protein
MEKVAAPVKLELMDRPVVRSSAVVGQKENDSWLKVPFAVNLRTVVDPSFIETESPSVAPDIVKYTAKRPIFELCRAPSTVTWWYSVEKDSLSSRSFEVSGLQLLVSESFRCNSELAIYYYTLK